MTYSQLGYELSKRVRIEIFSCDTEKNDELTDLESTEGLESLADSIPKAATGSQSTSSHHAFIRALINSQNPEGYISLCRTIATASPPKYGKINAPLLIIAGGEDKTSPLAGCQAILDRYVKS